MLSIGLVFSAGAASRYFDNDNYYGAGETKGPVSASPVASAANSTLQNR